MWQGRAHAASHLTGNGERINAGGRSCGIRHLEVVNHGRRAGQRIDPKSIGYVNPSQYAIGILLKQRDPDERQIEPRRSDGRRTTSSCASNKVGTKQFQSGGFASEDPPESAHVRLRRSWATHAAGAAYAAAAPDQSEVPTGGIQEVVVTAQRRTENAQNVPIAIQAFTGDTLKQLNVTNFDDLIQVLCRM